MRASQVRRIPRQKRVRTIRWRDLRKEVTANSPLQYLKKIRLARARDLIVQKNMKAYLAADAVGYESPSQFSREFKRHYGLSPAEMVRELKSM